jgi:hypothetical protein
VDYRDRIVVDCTKDFCGSCGTLSAQKSTCVLDEAHSTEPAVLESHLAPINLALSELIGDTIICPAANNTTSKWLMMVIFNTGVSLIIMPDLWDFFDAKAVGASDAAGRNGKRN